MTMATPAPTLHYAMVVIDVERSAERTTPEQIRNRERLYDINRRALRHAGVEPVAGEDRGDGCFQLFPASTPKHRLVGPFVSALVDQLRGRSGTDPMRLRLSLHAGEVARDPYGWGGADLNTAFRLADLPRLRTALACAPRAVLALAVSDVLYQGVVRHDYPESEPEAYRRIRYTAKEAVDQYAWIRVPGYVEPPGSGAPDGGREPGEDSRPTATPQEAARPHVVTSGIGVMRDLRGGIGVVHGDVRQTAPPAAPVTVASVDLRRELHALRQLITDALRRREIDDEDGRDALRELDEAIQHAESEDEEERGRLSRALRRLRGLLDHVAGVGDAISRILLALQVAS
ncbi:hypothetical protein ACTWP5_06420 [Streptomyces sp. 4N509B]|uniref:hypothetical protein n=1 Tax=Streptomyces sp. 4N509B TaxID=3457413 RepID=UPI003FD114EC